MVRFYDWIFKHGDGVNGIDEHAGLTEAVLLVDDLHVALIAPVCSPRVLHEEVFSAFFNAVANQEDRMVQPTVWAIRAIEDASARVMLPVPRGKAVDLDGDLNRAEFGQCCLDLVTVGQLELAIFSLFADKMV